MTRRAVGQGRVERHPLYWKEKGRGQGIEGEPERMTGSQVQLRLSYNATDSDLQLL